MSDTYDVLAYIKDILSRSHNVTEWPSDEQDVWHAWDQDFTSRHDMMVEYRATKILTFVSRFHD